MADNQKPMFLKASESADPQEGPEGYRRKPWKVLIADDEAIVHEITRQVLRNLRYEGRSVEFLSAYSGAETKKIVEEQDDIAVIILDVVMETETAGLDTAEYIRKTLKNDYVRIILRTGQPGTAPERKIILEYDINDYKDKTELTAKKLFSAIVTAIRDYNLISRLNRCLLGIETVVSALRDLLKIRTYESFAEGIMIQVLSLLDLEENGLYVDAAGCTTVEKEGRYIVIAGSGQFADPAYKDGSRDLPREITEMLDKSMREKGHIHANGEFVGFIPSESGDGPKLLYLQGIDGLDPKHRHILEVFLTNVSAGLDAVIELEALRAGADKSV